MVLQNFIQKSEKSGIKRFLPDDAREIQQQDKWNHTETFLMHGNPLLADWVTKKLGQTDGLQIFP